MCNSVRVSRRPTPTSISISAVKPVLDAKSEEDTSLTRLIMLHRTNNQDIAGAEEETTTTENASSETAQGVSESCKQRRESEETLDTLDCNNSFDTASYTSSKQEEQQEEEGIEGSSQGEQEESESSGSLYLTLNDFIQTIPTVPAGTSTSTNANVTQQEQDREDKKNVDKSVRFSSVTIREYPIALGDNPGGTGGVPLTIEWDYQGGEHLISLDSYEEVREWAVPRRFGIDLVLSRIQRAELLENVCSLREMHQACVAVKRAHYERFQSTRDNLALHWALERTARKWHHLIHPHYDMQDPARVWLTNHKAELLRQQHHKVNVSPKPQLHHHHWFRSSGATTTAGQR